MDVSCTAGCGKSLSSSLLSATFFPAALPFTSISLLAAPFSPDGPWEEEEDSSTALCPACGVAWTVLHIINLVFKGTHTHIKHSSAELKSQTLTPDYRQTRNRPAAVAEGEEEHAEDDAGDADMNADDDACGGGFALLVFHTVTRDVQH